MKDPLDEYDVPEKPYFCITCRMTKSKAWLALSYSARSVYLNFRDKRWTSGRREFGFTYTEMRKIEKISPGTFFKNIKELEKWGFIKVVMRGGRCIPNVYRVINKWRDFGYIGSGFDNQNIEETESKQQKEKDQSSEKDASLKDFFKGIIGSSDSPNIVSPIKSCEETNIQSRHIRSVDEGFDCLKEFIDANNHSYNVEPNSKNLKDHPDDELDKLVNEMLTYNYRSNGYNEDFDPFPQDIEENETKDQNEDSIDDFVDMLLKDRR